MTLGTRRCMCMAFGQGPLSSVHSQGALLWCHLPGTEMSKTIPPQLSPPVAVPSVLNNRALLTDEAQAPTWEAATFWEQGLVHQTLETLTLGGHCSHQHTLSHGFTWGPAVSILGTEAVGGAVTASAVGLKKQWLKPASCSQVPTARTCLLSLCCVSSGNHGGQQLVLVPGGCCLPSRAVGPGWSISPFSTPGSWGFSFLPCQ